MRQQILALFQHIIGIIPKEEDEFHMLCDLWDYCELTDSIEKELNIYLKDSDEKDEYSFDTVKDFIDWVLQYTKPETC